MHELFIKKYCYVIVDVKFVEYNNYTCNGKTVRDTVIMPSMNNDDANHPLWLQDITSINVDDESKVFIPRSSIK